MMRSVLTMTLCLFLTAVTGISQATSCKLIDKYKGEYVTIVKKKTHYEIVIDLPLGSSHLTMGTEYAEAIHAVMPDVEVELDSYLTELISWDADSSGIEAEELVQIYRNRVDDIKPQIPQEYKDEIDGMAMGFQGTADELGDGKISANELYILNLITDVMRGTACTAFAAFGRRSVSSSTIAARNLDWYQGAEGQLAQLHAVTTIRQGEKSIGMIGFLGMTGIISAMNDDHIFAAILDSQTGAAYSSAGKRSYIMDLRYALENSTTLDEVAAYMVDADHQYTFNHNIFLAAPAVARVVENNISDAEGNSHRAVRSWDSFLNSEIEWGVDNAVAVVNSFVLQDSTDYHTGVPYNYERWNFLRDSALSMGRKIDTREIRRLIGYHENALTDEPALGDIFYPYTLQSMIVKPKNFWLHIAFIPKSGIWDETPRYERVSFAFEPDARHQGGCRTR